MPRPKKIPSLDGAASRPLLTILELADWLRIHPTTLRRALATGRIPGFKLGGEWRASRDVIERWLLDRMNEQTALLERPGPWLLDTPRRRG